MITLSTVAYSLIGGIIPSLLWLFFWLHEDKKRPEPRGQLLRTFLFGMLAVVLVLPFQKIVNDYMPGMTVMAIFLWALFEEGFKFLAGYFGGIHSTEDDEPLDPIIYMITAALGFVALENALFIFAQLADQNIAGSIFTGNMRFIGPSLLHIISSAVVGFAMAFSFFKSRGAQRIAAVVGGILAVVLHTFFNILMVKQEAVSVFTTFGLVWVVVIVLLLLFEKVKNMNVEAISPLPPLEKE
jgi:protease PrsW